MGFNAAGALAVFQVIWRPSLLLPRVIVKDIRQLDLQKLKKRGIVGVVVDKDNCITKPKHDTLVPELGDSWKSLIKTFGRKNILVVSNSAGTRDDPGMLAAESVSRHLGVPLLLHATKKPGCIEPIRAYFSRDVKGKGRETYPDAAVVDVSGPTNTDEVYPDESASVGRRGILVIGDRVMTDVVLANRINARRKSDKDIEAVSVLTTHLWQREKFGTTLMRGLEGFAMRRAINFHRKRRSFDSLQEWKDCILPEALPVLKVEEPQVASSKTTPGEQGRAIWATITRPFRRMYERRLQRLRSSVDSFMSEARKEQYGFKTPEGISRVRKFTRFVEGRPYGNGVDWKQQ